jgi:glycosyltransferase involved in cell wall biosynthesis
MFCSKTLVTTDAASDLTTVAISLYNYERYIIGCLDSVRNQTAPAIDLIVVDDCSADRSCEVTRDWMERHAARFVQARLIRHRQNQGLAEARNTGFRLATGEFVFVLDADNVIYPRALVRLRSAIAETTDGAAYSQLEFFDSECCLGLADIWSKERFKKNNYVDAMALVRRAAWDAVGGYTQIKGAWEDYDFWCKFIDHEISALFVPEILCRYRVHRASMLRSETVANADRIAAELQSRHSWLELRTAGTD